MQQSHLLARHRSDRQQMTTRNCRPSGPAVVVFAVAFDLLTRRHSNEGFYEHQVSRFMNSPFGMFMKLCDHESHGSKKKGAIVIAEYSSHQE
jgi:hypothetical protein